METILHLWHDFFSRLGYPGLAGAVAAIAGLLGVVGRGSAPDSDCHAHTIPLLRSSEKKGCAA